MTQQQSSHIRSKNREQRTENREQKRKKKTSWRSFKRLTHDKLQELTRKLLCGSSSSSNAVEILIKQSTEKDMEAMNFFQSEKNRRNCYAAERLRSLHAELLHAIDIANDDLGGRRSLDTCDAGHQHVPGGQQKGVGLKAVKAHRSNLLWKGPTRCFLGKNKGVESPNKKH